MNTPLDPKNWGRTPFLDVVVDPLDRKDSLAACIELVEAERPFQHVVINAGKVVLAHKDPRLARIIADADLVNADGQSIVWGGRRLGIPIPERVAGIDLMNELVGEAAARGWGVFLLGARREVVTEVAERFTGIYKNLKIAGIQDGYFADSKLVARQIRDSGARIVFIALPSPMKEYFVEDVQELMGAVLAFGVGGSFDVVAGITNRAPSWMQKSGLEWFYRFWQEPRRMWKRYLIGNVTFIYLILRQMLRGRN